MAISPTVNGYQRRITHNRENSTPEQSTFNRKFGDKAYQIITSKFPKLLTQIITFKIIDSDPENGFSIGAFILRAGDDVRYVPVVMSGGEIASAEMVYDKGEDTLIPLSNDIVTDIINLDMTKPEKLVSSPMTEDTAGLFKEMYRPPLSSNISLASSVKIASLPNKFKKAISDYLISNPALLSKVAEWYPIDVLAEKLAQNKVAVAESPEPSEPNVIKLASLTAEAARALSSNEKHEILKHGYLIRKEAEDAIGAISYSGLSGKVESQLKLTEKPRGTSMHGIGYLFKLKNDEVVREKCMIAGNLVFTKNGMLGFSNSENLVISDMTDGITAEDLADFGASQISAFTPQCSGREFENSSIYVFYPTKDGTYKVLPQLSDGGISAIGSATDSVRTSDKKALSIWADSFQVKNIDGNISFGSRCGHGENISFLPQVSAGFVRISDTDAALPVHSYAIQSRDDRTVYIQSMGMLLKLIKSTGIIVRMNDNGAGITVSDSSNFKTASFKKIADAVEYLIDECRMSKKAVERLVSDKEILVLEKRAFVATPQQEYAQSGEQASPGMFSAMGQTGMSQDPMAMGQNPMGMDQGPVEIDEDVLAQAAGIQDEDLFDTGMLASVAANDDIKSLLVDMLPEFTDTCSMLGKAILLFVSNKDEIEDFYGDEDYGNLLGRIRKIFKMLGELVSELRRYINM